MKKNKYICFDRDGVVNFRLVDFYVKFWDELHFTEDFLHFFPIIRRQGYGAVLVTNQQGLSKGMMTEDDFHTTNNKMQAELLRLTGFQFDAVYYCGDLASANSFRRKPNPGMLLEAIDEWNIDKENSWMIGDSLSDMTAGRRAGLNTLLLGREHKMPAPDTDYHFLNLYQAEDFFRHTNLIK